MTFLFFFPGLKQALTVVNDFNPLMKDFPLNDLLAATELDKIRTALQSIFTHLRKIRTTKYPIQRALRLVEAISRDLSGQLLKVRLFLLFYFRNVFLAWHFVLSLLRIRAVDFQVVTGLSQPSVFSQQTEGES